MRQEIRVEACTGAALDVRAGQKLTVVDLCGGQVGDFFAQAAGNPGEFLSPGVTIDCNESLALRVGDTIYTNLYRPMFLLLRDDAGQNDLIHPSCRKEMTTSSTTTARGIPTAWTTSTARWGRTTRSCSR